MSQKQVTDDCVRIGRLRRAMATDSDDGGIAAEIGAFFLGIVFGACSIAAKAWIVISVWRWMQP